MRSRLICSLASVVVLASTGTASADITRVRMSIEDLPRAEAATKVDAKNAVLPDGARELSAVPKSWKAIDPKIHFEEEASNCTDDRRGSVSTFYEGEGQTQKIWESNGKFFLDKARVETKTGYVNVIEADRTPLGRVTDGIWAYRRAGKVVVVTAVDDGVFDRAIFYECRIVERSIASPAGTTTIDSSPKAVNEVMKQILALDVDAGEKRKAHPVWTGLEMRALVTVSKASADPAPMLNLVIRRP